MNAVPIAFIALTVMITTKKMQSRWFVMRLRGRKKMNSIWLMVGKNIFMCPVCKAKITGNENIKYQRYCYWCGTKMTQDEEANNETN